MGSIKQEIDGLLEIANSDEDCCVTILREDLKWLCKLAASQEATIARLEDWNENLLIAMNRANRQINSKEYTQ